MKNFALSSLFVLLSLQVGFTQITAFINEVNYLVSNPTEAFVEIAGQAGEDLTGYSLVGYAADGTVTFVEYISSGIIPNKQNGYGTIWIEAEQNGDDGGIALFNPDTSIVQFLSYGTQTFFNGIITAVEGPAAGLQSEYIGQQVIPTESLRLIGTGLTYIDFLWATVGANTPGEVNPNQVFGLLPRSTTLLPDGTAAADQAVKQTQPDQSLSTEFTLRYFPNPTADWVSIRFPALAGKGILELRDVSGHILQRLSLAADGTTVDLDLRPYPNGTYVLRYVAAGQNITKILVKQ